MAEYIDREALLVHMKDVPTWWGDEGGIYGGAHSYPDGMFDPNDVISSIEDAPAADVAPVVYAHWIADGYGGYHCPECGRFERWTPNYCPMCGAKMEKE